MLYVTTRDKTDAFTAPRTLSADRGPDGGLFVPFRMPKLTPEEVCALADMNFGKIVADILNRFFSANLTGWDVDFCVGRNPVKHTSMNYRIWVAEMWHNQNWNFRWLQEHLLERISGKQQPVTDWGNIAVRIAVLFGIFGEHMKNGTVDLDHPMDVAVMAGDFSGPMAVWYAREMGLPVGSIICSCNENGAPWDLLHRGQIHTDSVAVSTGIPEADYSLPPDLERLIYAVLGFEENRKYTEICHHGRLYEPDEESAERLSSGLFGAVVSRKRMEGIIRNVSKSGNYLLDPAGAFAYGGLQDYRAKTGVTGPALILSERSPSAAADIVASSLGIPVRTLLDQLQKR